MYKKGILKGRNKIDLAREEFLELNNKYQLIINATNIHQGGGRALLLSLLTNGEANVKVRYLLDERMVPYVEKKYLNQIKFFKPTVFGRIKSECWLRFYSGGVPILALGNLPPIFPNKSKILLFIQNKYLITNYTTKNFPIFPRIRIFVERMWLYIFKFNINIFIVQTSSMKKILNESKGFQKKPIVVIPFFDKNTLPSYKKENTIEIVNPSFVFPASGDPHKNHKNLVMAWVELAKDGLFPKLILTLNSNQNTELLEWINSKKILYKLQITNLEQASDNDVNMLISNASALIYPSLIESFGIPLVVAEKFNVPIIAAEMDYVRDISRPIQTFDPNSPTSISRAVKRFLGIVQTIENIVDPDQFYSAIIEMAIEASN